MRNNFRTYNLAVQFYRDIKTTQVPCHLRIQLDKAASSIALNLAEGTGRSTMKDQRRFFVIAMGSLREVQAIMQLESDQFSANQHKLIDHVAASLFNLIRNTGV